MNSKFFILAAAAVAVSCTGRNLADVSATNTVRQLKNIRATHCEIFIDKAAISETFDPSTNGKVQELHLFVKILKERLDAPVQKVIYFGEYTQSSMYGRTGGDNWSEHQLESHDSASDYFTTKLKLVKLYRYGGSDQKEVFHHSGAVFVESANGTRYWANAEKKDNFEINMDFFKGGAIPELRILTSFTAKSEEVLGLKKTSESGEIGRFFNPSGCR